ncbi:hypothetical protein NMY22_g18595 [Coprinellus aureogranulatus]|nr:hypothetical protein NMY22_g18595 [Coprinellus aureogranulatus]
MPVKLNLRFKRGRSLFQSLHRNTQGRRARRSTQYASTSALVFRKHLFSFPFSPPPFVRVPARYCYGQPNPVCGWAPLLDRPVNWFLHDLQRPLPFHLPQLSLERMEMRDFSRAFGR